jgi:CRISPR/Cas system Type II protein with McrA/HNH and RuvC-like nuclease domain
MFDEKKIEQVWSKASVVSNNDPNIWRKDYAGAWIKRDQYELENEYGWKIDHIKPLSKEGSDELSNLLPLQLSNNLSKGDDFPEWETNMSADGVHNNQKKQTWIWQE